MKHTVKKHTYKPLTTMTYSLPHTIENHLGEKLIFRSIRHEPDGDVLIAENFVQPGSGPPMHTHWLQDEGFTVLEGRIGYQIAGQPEQYAEVGESVVFGRGVAQPVHHGHDDLFNKGRYRLHIVFARVAGH